MAKPSKPMTRASKAANRKNQPLEPVSSGIIITIVCTYLVLFAVNLSRIPCLQGDYASFVYILNMLSRGGSGGLLFFVTIAICIMLAVARSQPFRFLTRYAILILVLTIYPLPVIYANCPCALSLIALIALFVLPIVKFYQYIRTRRSVRAKDRKKYDKATATHIEEDAQKQRKYSVAGVVIGIIVTIPTLIGFFGEMTNTFAFICGIFTFLFALPFGFIVAIILIVHMVMTHKYLSRSTLLLGIVGIILCLLPTMLLVSQLFD